MNGYVDLWVRPADLEDGLTSLVWAASEGFTDLVLVCSETRFAQYREAISALDLGLSVRRRTAVDLARPAFDRTQVWGDSDVFVQLPGKCDLKQMARVMGEIARSGFTPVVIGAARAPEVQRQPELLRYLLNAGAVLCGMAGCAGGKYGSGCRMAARRIAALGYYHLFAGYVQDRVSVTGVARLLEDVRPSWRSTQSELHSALVVRPELVLNREKDCGAGEGRRR
ncbi:MAG: hypothetical protein R6U70_07795 [Bacillota bacterium]